MFENNDKTDHYIIEPAKESDGFELCNIYEEESAPGNLEITFTRRDNAYLSMMQEGKIVEVIVCRRRNSLEIVGFGAYAINEYFLHGTKEQVAYLFGMRCRKKYRNKAGKAIPLIYSYIKKSLMTHKVKFIFTSILDDNIKAQKFLTRSHKGLPNYKLLEKFEVYSIKTTKKILNVPKNIVLVSALDFDENKFYEFANEVGRKYQLFPDIEEVAPTLKNFLNDCYLLIDKTTGELLACGFCWDQRSFKQYILQGYKGLYKGFYFFSKILTLLGYPNLPVPGSILNYFTLSFWLVKDNNSNYLKWFIDLLSKEKNSYDFFALGIGSSHPLKNTIKKLPHWIYKSNIYSVSWKDYPKESILLNNPNQIYIECGRL
ncbi:hypothetical protein A2526_04755 [candidate division WOR-1 bacterium RIFOXYD2_FULL_36_8]|uniref:N-acetyltransferase domain-containing protein n=1 Tax=candidate division WOR-1 bacterium RIFOXYB2_FULL_36_35 TaxID=1802578 RepID=A0A1F4S6F7_UNCSA|nr:MAG: hypothetical protein A2230_01360 [candidate division WOR-1 bacterium RIFOXYA2_FULL_36_21]OGC14377.1 MAG: hypothetical protein A2282_07995 [candidate division WOR-1 bacterium RIFOXYA12_FULL_36_13]OGC15947.1 MAG: hypothetical protein A2290_06830 [candidate division WOR-1 bacterium RIFOXYB2_FULL_36_35]OGC37273.1 MAG: hypothetical protein A2526_04755 [candidate division WOR-1 bacterium RIFOXYD2_FULL_36_8]